MDQAELSESQNRAVGEAVREQLARRRMSRQRLADEAKISISTLEKALNGSRPFTLATIVRLETALGVALRSRPPEDAPVRDAPVAAGLGAYTRAAVAWLEGDYLTLRPSFEKPGTLFAYRTAIAWDAAAGCLGFQESERLDAAFSQKGVVSVPSKSGQIYLQTNEDGQLRLAILGRPQIGGEMYGILTTLLAGPGGQLQPVSAPLALLPMAKTRPAFGRIAPGDPAHASYRAHLARALDGGFVRFVTV